MINNNHFKYYESLEEIRESGVCNMYGAAPYLRLIFPELSEEKSESILIEWMENYSLIQTILNWKR